MSIIKSYAVGNGDMFCVEHNSDNLTIIDCCLTEENHESIVADIKERHGRKGCSRFISTHPDEDHLRGLRHLFDQLNISNFYCVKNSATKEDESDDFLFYCEKRDAKKTFHIHKGCSRTWMNKSNDVRSSAGINIVWPVLGSAHFTEALAEAEGGGSPNNISTVLTYSLTGGVKAMWFGDLETEFMDSIAYDFEWPKADLVFAAHHGRYSGKIPDSILDQVNPKIIVIGEAPSRHLHYYGDYRTLTQNSAGDLTFDCLASKINIFCSDSGYSVDFLQYETATGSDYYLGTLYL